MLSSPPHDAALWHQVIERLDTGVVIFNQKGVAIYANPEAGRLLEYPPRDVLGLDVRDFVSLCQPERLDAERFADALLKGEPGERPGVTFEVATSARRLRITPFRFHSPDEPVTVLLLREAECWQASLIAETAISEMHSPLSFALGYCEALLTRLKSGDAHSFELLDLARIIHEGVDRSLSLLHSFSRLREVAPHRAVEEEVEAIRFEGALKEARDEIARQHGAAPLPVEFDLPPDLPPVLAAASHLHAALCALLDWAARSALPQERMILSAHDRRHYVQVMLERESGGFRGYELDSLPLAIAEQAILQMGGRVWIEAPPARPAALCFSLPAQQAGG